VFDRGRIEQVGTPAEVYERPATPFVAGFVGTSNLLTDEGGGTYCVRPEKIRILDEDDKSPDAVAGTVADAVYLGDATRFLVDLDSGGRLTVLRQNLDTGSAEAAAYRGARVRLRWDRRHNVPVTTHNVPVTTHESESSCA
jgi:putative spermidine/putrescine transport system ATP-binding protein